MSAPVAPPTSQEVSRKLSIHSRPKPKMNSPPAAGMSGNESDEDSVFAPEQGAAQATPHAPLSAIAEGRHSGEGEESDEEDEEEHEEGDGEGEGEHVVRKADVSDIKAGYLWKKGERRKTWKRRWFVLRPGHLAYYKTSAEYQLHRLLDLHDVHTCTPVALKKHPHAFGVVAATRTFYLQAESDADMHDWVRGVREAREALLAASTPASVAPTPPIPIPAGRAHAQPVTPSPPSYGLHAITSSESEDASPGAQRMYATSSSPQSYPLSSSPHLGAIASPPKDAAQKEATKTVVSGYLMKCGSKRRNWRKRWFVLNGDKLMYSGSHMDTKPHRQIPLSQILDAFEYDLPASPPPTSPPPRSASGEDAVLSQHTFKIVTTKRTLLLCAPGEEEEIKWLSAVRALIARRSEAGVVPGDKRAAGGEAGGGTALVATGSGGSGSGLRTRKEAQAQGQGGSGGKASVSAGSSVGAPIGEGGV